MSTSTSTLAAATATLLVAAVPAAKRAPEF